MGLFLDVGIEVHVTTLARSEEGTPESLSRLLVMFFEDLIYCRVPRGWGLQ